MNDTEGCECEVCNEDEVSGALRIELDKTARIRGLCEKVIHDLDSEMSRSYSVAERALMALNARVSVADVLLILNGAVTEKDQP